MKITKDWLESNKACEEGIVLFLNHESKLKTDKSAIESLIKIDHFDWANWVVVRMMDEKQKIAYAIFSARSALHIFEGKYPEDKRPREAIEAAEKYLECPSEKTKYATHDAAYASAHASAHADTADAYADAAYAAAAFSFSDASAYAASDAASDAASAAAYAASAASADAAKAVAAYAYADAAEAAASAAAYAASAAASGKKAIKTKIIGCALSLLDL